MKDRFSDSAGEGLSVAPDEGQLIERSLQGNQDAIAQLVRRHYNVSLYIARSILHDDDEAEDAVQSAFCKAIQHLGKFRRDARFGTWITRIVMNESLGRLRSVRSRQAGLEKLVKTGNFTSFILRESTPEELAERRETSMLMRRAIIKLPMPLRQACELGLQGLTATDAASKLHINVSTLKVRQFRARAVLRSQLWPKYHSPRTPLVDRHVSCNSNHSKETSV